MPSCTTEEASIRRMPAALFWVVEEARRKADVADLQAVHPVEPEGEPDVVETW